MIGSNLDEDWMVIVATCSFFYTSSESRQADICSSGPWLSRTYQKLSKLCCVPGAARNVFTRSNSTLVFLGCRCGLR